MASPNRHWPSMFRSKHATQPWQVQADMSSSPPSLVSGSTATTTGCSLKSPFSSGPDQERSTEPKPRWSPRPEQIRILEAIFNSGMVNPPRDEIPRIRMKLQEYGQVGDANVFYWFQNRKSRSKNKLRAAAAARAAPAARACAPARQAAAPPPAHPQQVRPLVSPVAPASSSSSSSDRSSGSSKPAKRAALDMSDTTAMDLLSPLAAACHQQLHCLQGRAPAPAPAPAVQEAMTADELIFRQWPQGHCLSAGELAAILGAQYMPVSAEQPPAASPAGMFLGLCNDVARPTSPGHRSCAWGAGLGGHCWPSSANQLSLGKNTAVAREEAHEDATKLRLLQFGFGVTSPNAAVSALPLPSSPDSAITVASKAATGGLTSLYASTVAAGGLTYDHFQGLADARFTGAAAAPTASVGVARPATAVVCIAGTGAMCNVAAAHLDVKTYFGEAAVLIRCNGDRAVPVLVDDSGVTVEPLQQGAFYLLI